MTPTLSVAGSQLSVTVLLLADPLRLTTSLGGVVSLPGGGGSFSSGAAHGDVGPAVAAAPFSKIVDSVDGSAGAIHMPRDPAPSARSMAACASRVYVPAHSADPAAPYASVPSEPAALVARSVRRPLTSNASPGTTRRCSSSATGSGAPVASCAVPWIWIVPGPVWTGRVAVTLRTVLSSTDGTASWLLIRTVSPGRMSGVTPTQQ